MTSFVVAIPTYRRPADLARCLTGVLAHVERANADPSAGMSGSVLVIDNDPDRSGKAVVDHLDHALVRYVTESRPGIANVRNTALAQAQEFDLLAFIDDDEHPLPGWLSTLLSTWSETHASAVAGRVVSEFEVPLTSWVAAGDFFLRRRLPTGTVVPTAAAGNLLLDLRQVRRFGITFDAGLGLSGGEDTLFTRRLTAAGGRIVWCNESEAVDRVPRDRCSARWVLTRAWSHGNNDTAVKLRTADQGRGSAVVRLRAIGGGVLRMAGGVFRAGYGLVARSLRHQARGLRTACRGAGMAAGALGVRYREYARPADES